MPNEQKLFPNMLSKPPTIKQEERKLVITCFWCKRRFIDDNTFVIHVSEEITLCNQCKELFRKQFIKEN